MKDRRGNIHRRKPICLFLFLYLSAFLGATVIRHPAWKSRNTALFRIDSIVVLPDVTQVCLSCEGNGVRWSRISPDIYLTDGETFKLKAMDMDGADFGRRFLWPDSGMLPLVLYFPALPARVEKVDLRQEGSDPWTIREIALTRQSDLSIIPAFFRGNWLEKESGNRWVLGLWDDTAIWKGECWNYCVVEEKGGTLSVVLEKEGRKEKLRIDALADGDFRLSTDGRKAVSVSLTADYTDFSGPDRNPAVPVSLCSRPDSATVRGYVRGYDPLLGMDTVTLYWDNVITGENGIIPVKITPRGTFEIRLMAWYPVQQTLFFKKGCLNFYLEPGDNLMLFADMEELIASGSSASGTGAEMPGLRYMGDSERMNRELAAYRSQKQEPVSFVPSPVPDPAGYKQAILTRLKEEENRLERFITDYRISARCAQLLRMTLPYAGACRLLDYERYYSIRSGEKAAALFSPDYYRFITELPADDPLVLSVAWYKLFMDRLEKCRPVMNCRQWSVDSLLEGFRKEGEALSGQDAELVRFSAGLNKWSDTLTFENYSSRIRAFNEKYGFLQKVVREKIWIDRIRRIMSPGTGSSLPLHGRLLFTRRFASRIRYSGHTLTEREVRLYEEPVGDEWLNRVVQEETAGFRK